jgi:hypothetical protein
VEQQQRQAGLQLAHRRSTSSPLISGNITSSTTTSVGSLVCRARSSMAAAPSPAVTMVPTPRNLRPSTPTRQHRLVIDNQYPIGFPSVLRIVARTGTSWADPPAEVDMPSIIRATLSAACAVPVSRL